MHPLQRREREEGAAETRRLLSISITAIGKELVISDALLVYLVPQVIDALDEENTTRSLFSEIRSAGNDLAIQQGRHSDEWEQVLLDLFQENEETAAVRLGLTILRLRKEEEDFGDGDDSLIRWAQSTLYD